MKETEKETSTGNFGNGERDFRIVSSLTFSCGLWYTKDAKMFRGR